MFNFRTMSFITKENNLRWLSCGRNSFNQISLGQRGRNKLHIDGFVRLVRTVIFVTYSGTIMTLYRRFFGPFTSFLLFYLQFSYKFLHILVKPHPEVNSKYKNRSVRKFILRIFYQNCDICARHSDRFGCFFLVFLFQIFFHLKYYHKHLLILP